MTSTSCLIRLREVLHRFRRDSRGNIMITFAFALLPLVGFIGTAVDYSRAGSARTALQAAADATALMLSKKASTLTSAQLQTQATAYFNALFTRPEATGTAVTATYSSSSGNQVTVSATSSLTTYFIKVVGTKTVNIAATATSKWGTTRLRVALALDVTGSMASDGKMDALKTATKNLLTQLQNAASANGDVYVSIIPFARNVNVGVSNYNATWIDWTDWEDEPDVTKPSNWSNIGPGSVCPFITATHGFTCTTGPANTAANTATIPSSGTYKGYVCPGKDNGKQGSQRYNVYYNGCYDSVASATTTTVDTGRNADCDGYSNCTCTGSGSSKVCKNTTYGAPYTHNWIVNARNTWTGCVTERGTYSGPSGDYDRKVTAPTTSIKATLFPAMQYATCPESMMGLNYNWTSMQNKVDDFEPVGATNQPIGLVWAWQSLVGGGPLTMPAKDSNYVYNDVIILMSDGLNTLNRWNGNGSDTSTSVDKRMYESSTLGTCANAKAAGITIYTLHVNTDGDPTSTLLQNCASTTDKFWVVTTAGAINSVFSTIGTNLTQLRISN